MLQGRPPGRSLELTVAPPVVAAQAPTRVEALDDEVRAGALVRRECDQAVPCLGAARARVEAILSGRNRIREQVDAVMDRPVQRIIVGAVSGVAERAADDGFVGLRD